MERVRTAAGHARLGTAKDRFLFTVRVTNEVAADIATRGRLRLTTSIKRMFEPQIMTHFVRSGSPLIVWRVAAVTAKGRVKDHYSIIDRPGERLG